jgi:hypothetical protein
LRELLARARGEIHALCAANVEFEHTVQRLQLQLGAATERILELEEDVSRLEDALIERDVRVCSEPVAR